MSPLRPIVRRQQGLLRNIRRNYATPAAPSSSAKEASAKGAEAVTKSKEAGNAAGQATVAKANDLLQRGMEKVGPMANKIGQTTANAMSKIPGGGEKVVGGVQSLIPPTMYYGKVGQELAKEMFRGQKMSPPAISDFTNLGKSVWNGIRNPSSLGSPTTMVDRVRGASRQDVATIGVLFAELLGFFTVGEMIGRRKIVGYHGPSPASQHH